jgi:hypothetical protein
MLSTERSFGSLAASGDPVNILERLANLLISGKFPERSFGKGTVVREAYVVAGTGIGAAPSGTTAEIGTARAKPLSSIASRLSKV